MVVWIEKPVVLAIHDRELAEYGGSAGVRAPTRAAFHRARPQQLYAYGDPAPDLADLAASLAFGLARNHPFVDGNKRTAAVCCETFIELNDAELHADDLTLYSVYRALAEGTLTEREFAAWLRTRIELAPGHRVHEPRARYSRR